MSLLARAVRALVAASPDRLPLSSSWQTTAGMLGGGTTMQEAYLRAYGQVGWLFAVVNRISEGVAQLKWHGYETRWDGKREERPDHPAVRLWRDVNDFYTTFEFVETFSQHYELVGEAWWVLLDGPGGVPVEIWPVRPDRMSPVPSRDEYIAGYVYRSPLDGRPIPLARESVIFLRRPNPLDPYRGAGMVQTILADLEGERMAALWNRNFFYNSAEPGGIIEYDQTLTEPEFQRQLLRWREQHQGVANAHRVALIEKGKWVDRKLSQRDMQFKDLRITNRDAILGAAGIPKSVLGITEDVNRASAEAGEVVFGRWVVRPRAERIKQALNERLAPRFPGKPIEFGYEDPTPANREQALKEATDGLAARIMSITEARQRIGMDSPPAEELQRLTLAQLAEPLGVLIRAGFEPEAALRALGLAPVRHLGLVPVTVQPDGGASATQPAQRALKAPSEDPPLAALPSPFDDAELAMRRAWARRLARERDALIAYVGEYKALGTALRKIEVSDLGGYDWDWWEKYGEEVVAEIAAAFTLAATAQAPEWAPTLAQRAAEAWARVRGAELLRIDGEVNVVRFTQRRVGELVAQTIERGDSLQTLQKALREDFAFSRDRAENIARTETATALGHGGYDGAMSQQMDEKRWVTQGDSHVEAECIANAAVGWIEIGKLFPSGHDHIPAHNMCLPGHTRVSAQDVAAASKRWYDGEIVIFRTAGGKELSATPNHPILTARGWVAAGALVKGDDVICGSGRKRRSLIDDNDDDVPASIEEIAEAFGRTAQVMAVEVPTAREDFHGDGGGSKVAVIWSDLLLRGRRQPALTQEGREVTFDRRLVEALGGAGMSVEEFAFRGRVTTLRRGVGGGDLSFPLNGGHLRPLEPFGIALRAPSNAKAGQSYRDDQAARLESLSQSILRPALVVQAGDLLGRYSYAGAVGWARADDPGGSESDVYGNDADAELACQIVRGAAGPVFTDEIVHVERQRWSGHVYNLQTAARFYVAEGIITHNCRCKTGYRHTPLAEPEADGPPRLLAEARCPRCNALLETDVPAGTALWCRRCKMKVMPREGKPG